MGEEIWLDPTEEEGKVSSRTLILSGMPALGTITSVWQSGSMTPDYAIKVCFPCFLHPSAADTYRVPQCMEACQECYTDVHAVIAQALLENAQNT